MIYDAETLSIEAFDKLPVMAGRPGIIKACLERVPAEGHVLEFGVWAGGSINFIADLVPGKIVHGFDSFEGLPEDWVMDKAAEVTTHKKGHFAVKGLPAVRKNVVLHKGWFEKTVPAWLEANEGPVSFLHNDSDLYSSTACVLTEFNKRLVPGTIILFDELSDWSKALKKVYPNWREHEWKALLEWMRDYDRKIIPLFRTSTYQAAVMVEG